MCNGYYFFNNGIGSKLIEITRELLKKILKDLKKELTDIIYIDTDSFAILINNEVKLLKYDNLLEN